MRQLTICRVPPGAYTPPPAELVGRWPPVMVRFSSVKSPPVLTATARYPALWASMVVFWSPMISMGVTTLGSSLLSG